MTTKLTYIFNVEEFEYDDDLIEVLEGDVKLKDLGEGTYSTANPDIVNNVGIVSNELVSIETEVETPENTAIQYIVKVDNQKMYWDSVSEEWADSDGTFEQSNSLSDINDNLDSLELLAPSTIKIYSLLNSDGAATPTLSSMSITYSVYVYPDEELNTVFITGYMRDSNNVALSGIKIKAIPSDVLNISDKNFIVGDAPVEVLSGTDGFFKMELITHEDITYDFVLDFGNNYIKRYKDIVVVDNGLIINFNNLIAGEGENE